MLLYMQQYEFEKVEIPKESGFEQEIRQIQCVPDPV